MNELMSSIWHIGGGQSQLFVLHSVVTETLVYEQMGCSTDPTMPAGLTLSIDDNNNDEKKAKAVRDIYGKLLYLWIR